MFRRRYIESNVVNEENGEDEIDPESSNGKKPLNFSNISFNDDLPSRFSKSTFKLDPIIKRRRIPSSTKIYDISKHLSINMDPVVEVKEDDKNETLKKINSINSPRVKLFTDSMEDNTINSPKIVSSTSYHLNRDYFVTLENEEAIAEDNNENLVDLLEEKKRTSTHHKNIIENIIDKEENPNLVELNVNSEISFEPIKEENIEEDDKDIMTHKKSSSN